jgi:putative SOS response-associated peptidase YedK
VAPDQPILGVRAGSEGVTLETFVWGLKPSWWKKKGRLLINARAETLLDKPMFRRMGRSRCVIPMNGFYEWAQEGARRRVPYFVRPEEGGLWAVAGLWVKGEGNGPPRCVLITIAAPEAFRSIHPRIPAVLMDKEAIRLWLDPRRSLEEVHPRLTTLPAHRMLWHPVSPRVNNPKVDDPSLIQVYQDQRM